MSSSRPVQDYSFELDPRFCWRSPLLPLARFVDLGSEIEGIREGLRELFEVPEIRDALFIASPGLHENLSVGLDKPDSAYGRQVERSLIRYVARMTGRATPFGAFSGVSVGSWADATDLALGPIESHRRRTQLDHDYLSALSSTVRADPELRAEFTFYPNSTLYASGGRVRYIEERVRGRTRSHHLVSAELSDELRAVLERSKDGATREALGGRLLELVEDVTAEEVQGFVDELIDSQILVSRVAPAVTGGSAARSLVAKLRELPSAGQTAAALERSLTELDALDREGVGVPSSRYVSAAEHLKALPVPVDLNRLFQVDLAKLSSPGRIHRRVAQDLKRAVGVLDRIRRSAEDAALIAFREDFANRFGEQEVPLLVALDEESGIGFAAGNAPSLDASPLLAGIPFRGPTRESGAVMGAPERHLIRRYGECIARGDDELALTNADIDKLSVEQRLPLPATFATMATVIAASPEAVDSGAYRVVLEPTVGPSGMRLVGRFCHLDPELESLVRDHIRSEEAQRPDAIFAEVAHLPGGRVGNVLCRPVLREFEIPFLGESGALPERQIPVQDLWVRVENGHIGLRSRRLNREVIPRLTNAHNYATGLGPYRFLCALQSQHLGTAAWSWGPLQDAPYLPRVSWGRVVLSRARWRLFAEDLEPLAKAAQGQKKAKTPAEIQAHLARQVDAVARLRRERKLPRLVTLADDDLDLLVDFDNPLSVESFVHGVKSKASATLSELLPGPDELVARGPGGDGSFTHELIVSMRRQRRAASEQPRRPPTQAPKEPAAPRRSAPPPIRTFPPGSPWLYAKLYAGASAQDDLLREVIAPLNAQARARGMFERWFFVRYADPDPHLRIRYNGDPAALWRELLPQLSRSLAPYFPDGRLWSFELGTYEREVERYGGPAGLAICEDIFSADSDAALAIVERLSGDAGADARWRLAICGADQLLDDLGFTLARKLELIHAAREAFFDEFRVDSGAMKQIGRRYRVERDGLAALLGRDPGALADHPLSPGLELLTARAARVRAAAVALRAERLSLPVEQIAGSIVHMQFNRLLRSAHRAHEVVLYDLLKRHYESERARSRGRE